MRYWGSISIRSAILGLAVCRIPQVSQASRTLSLSHAFLASALVFATVVTFDREHPDGPDVAQATRDVLPETLLTRTVDHEDVVLGLEQVGDAEDVPGITGADQNGGGAQVKPGHRHGVEIWQRRQEIGHHGLGAAEHEVGVGLGLVDPLRRGPAVTSTWTSFALPKAAAASIIAGIGPLGP